MGGNKNPFPRFSRENDLSETHKKKERKKLYFPSKWERMRSLITRGVHVCVCGGGGGGFNIPAYPRHKKEEEHISKWTSDLKEVQN